MSDSQYQDLTEWWRERNKKGYQWKIADRDFLHDFSRRCVEVARPYLGDVSSLHEIGCGMGRNLNYFRKAFEDRGFPVPQITGNDLSRVSCYKHMDPDLRATMSLHECDTLKYVRQEVEAGRTVDMLYSSDHMIHLSPEIIKELHGYMARYAKKYIMIKEATHTDREARKQQDHYWFIHDYDFEGFEIVTTDRDNRYDPSGEYEITIFKRKDDTQLADSSTQGGRVAAHAQKLPDEMDWARSQISASGKVLAIGVPEGVLPEGVEVERLRPGGMHHGAPQRLEAMPYTDGAFDAVVLDDTLHDAFDFATALAECKRVLKAGGQLVLLLGNAGFYKSPLLKRKLGSTAMISSVIAAKMVASEALDKAISEAGFKVSASEQFGETWSGTRARRALNLTVSG